ncbi:MAG: DUF1376 domain-containing protein [Devosia sp.]
MADYPALPLWTDKYFADTRHLTRDQHGAYLLLLMEAWRRPTCSLPDDDSLLARLTCSSPDEWASLKPTVMAFWNLDGRSKTWTQKALSKEREFLSNQRKSQKSRIAKRWNKTEKTDTGSIPDRYPVDTPTPTPTLTEVEEPNGSLSETSSDASKAKASKRGQYAAEFEAAWRDYPTDANMSKKEASDAWKRLDDADRQAFVASIPAFKAYCAKNPEYRPIHMNRYIVKRRFEGHLAPGNAPAGGPDPGYVSLPPEHPDFRAVERLRGKPVIVGNRGKATFIEAEIEQARRYVADHPADMLEVHR